MPSKRHGCSCEKCRECCRREPGWFMPDEILPAASYLKLSASEFEKQYCKDAVEDGVRVLSPRSKPNSTECLFLDGKGFCIIHPVKPYECRKVYGCERSSKHKRIREIMRKRWRSVKFKLFDMSVIA